MMLLVDDGNVMRLAREWFFRADGVIGVFSGSHTKSYLTEYLSYINFASAYDNNEEQNQLDALNAGEGQSNTIPEGQ